MRMNPSGEHYQRKSLCVSHHIQLRWKKVLMFEVCWEPGFARYARAPYSLVQAATRLSNSTGIEQHKFYKLFATFVAIRIREIRLESDVRVNMEPVSSTEPNMRVSSVVMAQGTEW